MKALVLLVVLVGCWTETMVYRTRIVRHTYTRVVSCMDRDWEVPPIPCVVYSWSDVTCDESPYKKTVCDFSDAEDRATCRANAFESAEDYDRTWILWIRENCVIQRKDAP